MVSRPALHKDGGQALHKDGGQALHKDGGQALDLLTIGLKTDSNKPIHLGILSNKNEFGARC
jgi:hypothetical protein